MNKAELAKLLSKVPKNSEWKGSFADYLDIVEKHPSVADRAHTRIYKAIVREGRDEQGRYNFFKGKIFGLDHTLKEFMEYLQSAAQGLDTRQRMPLLAGPPSSSKSTLVSLLKRALEEYSATDEGAVYAIAGCPLHEDPLHLLAAHVEAKKELEQRLGITIEGGLCPVCTYRLDNEWDDFFSVPVERVLISESRRIGVGSFAPGDPKVVSLEDLVGGMDLVKVSELGTESHPLAFNFTGSLEVASRGIMEYIELLKSPSELLYPLLSLLQEHLIKAGRFAMFYADELVIGASNMAEFDRFAKNPLNEAIQNRSVLIKVPYVVKVDDEVAIYEKLFREAHSSAHIAPHTLRAAALWAVMTRLTPQGNVNVIGKARMYNGEETSEHTPQEIESWQEKGREAGEGMTGIGPRTVMNALSQAIARKDNTCLNGMDTLMMLHEIKHQVVGDYDDGKMEELINHATADFTKRAEQDIQQAFIDEFDSAAQTLLTNYLDNAQAFLNNELLKDSITGELLPPDENLMGAIESHTSIPDKKEFRREILLQVGALSRRGKEFRWDSHPKLKEAIQTKLYNDLNGTLKVTLSSVVQDKGQRDRIASVKQKLISDYGYCESCAEATMNYIGRRLSR